MSRPPLTLKLYALLVLGAGALAPGYDGGMWWAGMVLVGLGALWVLLGSRFGWWVQAFAVASALAGVWGVWRSYGDEMQAARVFVPPVTLAALTVILVAAAILLVAPATRSYCTDRSGGSRSGLGIVLGAMLVASFPAVGLSVESRLPSDGVYESTPNPVFVGYDPKAPSAFFVGGSGERYCVVILEPRSRSRSCRHGLEPAYSDARTGNVMVWMLPKHVERAEVVYKSGASREALLLDGSGRVNVFYTTESLDDVRGIRVFDGATGKLVPCSLCY